MLKEYLSTKSGRRLVLQKIAGSKGIKQLDLYARMSKEYFSELPKVYVESLKKAIENDREPLITHVVFEEAYKDFPEFYLDRKKIDGLGKKLSNVNMLEECVNRLLDSNFISETESVFLCLLDSALKYFGTDLNEEVKKNLLYGHMIAISLSEAMDRIIDKDEDLEYLESYSFLLPHILSSARGMISRVGESVYDSFEKGFKRALEAESLDGKIKKDPKSLDYWKMEKIYDKYRAVIGTAGRDMALNREPLADIYEMGMSKAAEAGGCIDEFNDSLSLGNFEIPSWPFFFTINTGNPRKAFELTLEKGKCYLREAKMALDMLPPDFPARPLIESLFFVLEHKMEYDFKKVIKKFSFSS
jgi:hypothetical protein